MKVSIYQDQRVLTTAQLAEAYGVTRKKIAYNFNHNKDRYTEGKHYIALTDAEKRDFLNRHDFQDGSVNATTLYLWTERGAWMHAKSLNTDKAWQAYEMLVDEYYRVKDAQPVAQLIDDPMINKAERLLSFIRNNSDIIDSELSTILQRSLAKQIAGNVVQEEPMLPAASDGYIYTTADIAAVTGLSIRAVSLIASRHRLRKPEFSAYLPLGGRSKHLKQIHYNEAGRTKLIVLARKVRK